MIAYKHANLGVNQPIILGCGVDYALNYNPNTTRDNGSCIYPDNSENVVIVEASPENVQSHGIYIEQAFRETYSSFSNSIIFRDKFFVDGYQYCYNTDCQLMIFSYAELSAYIFGANSIYPYTQTFIPLGSNDFILLDDVTSIPSVIVVGAGLTENETAYGPALEFWDNENVGSTNKDSSFSNGTIAAKFLLIKNALSCSNWEARVRARITADRNETRRPPGVIWTQEDGFGKINVQAAIDFVGSIPADPYINGGNAMYPYIP